MKRPYGSFPLKTAGIVQGCSSDLSEPLLPPADFPPPPPPPPSLPPRPLLPLPTAERESSLEPSLASSSDQLFSSSVYSRQGDEGWKIKQKGKQSRCTARRELKRTTKTPPATHATTEKATPHGSNNTSISSNTGSNDNNNIAVTSAYKPDNYTNNVKLN